MRMRNFLVTSLVCLALLPAAFAQSTAKPTPTPTPAAPKTGTTPKKPATKKMPARDPKTGRFVKSSDKAADKGTKGGAMTGAGDKTKKKMPARDPKTGKFIKSPKP